MSGYQWVEGSSSLYELLELIDNSVVRTSLCKRIPTPGLKVRAKRESSPFPRPWSPRLLHQSARWCRYPSVSILKPSHLQSRFPSFLSYSKPHLPNGWSQLQPCCSLYVRYLPGGMAPPGLLASTNKTVF
jgi:hypothetical protein